MTTPVSFVKNSICSQKLTLSHFQLTCSSFQATISPLFGQNTWRSVLEEVLVKRTKRGNACNLCYTSRVIAWFPGTGTRIVAL